MTSAWGSPQVVKDGLRFPEGAYWSRCDRCLYFVEWAGDVIWRLRLGEFKVVYRTRAGDGPCGIGQDATGNLWVTMYQSRRLVKLSPEGQELLVVESFQQEPFRGPNQLVVDQVGGVYFTDSGNFEDDWRLGRPAASVYYLMPTGEVQRLASGLCFANGIGLSPDGRRLIVNEHRKNRVVSFSVLPDGSLSPAQVLAELDDHCLLDPSLSYELGPDSLTIDEGGRLWVAHYGGGKVLLLSLEGEIQGQISLPRGRKPTNVAFDEDARALYVTEAEEGLLYRIQMT
jgi:gluconolactonase